MLNLYFIWQPRINYVHTVAHHFKGDILHSSLSDSFEDKICCEFNRNSRSRSGPRVSFIFSRSTTRNYFLSLDLRSNKFSSKPENEDDKSGSRLDDRDWRRIFLDLVSKPEIKCQKILVSSRCARLNGRNSHSRLEIEKVTLVDLCFSKGGVQIIKMEI